MGGSPRTLCTVSWFLGKEDRDTPSFASKTSANGMWRHLISTLTEGKSSPVTRADGGKSLTAPPDGERPNDTKLQLKQEHGARAARQQPHQTQPKSADAAAKTISLEWAYAVSLISWNLCRVHKSMISGDQWKPTKTTTFQCFHICM